MTWHDVGPVIAFLRGWESVYQRWWEHPGRRDDAVLPWSAEDQDRLEGLAGADPAILAASARRLARVAAELDEIAGAVAGIGLRGGIGAAAAQRCAELGSAVADRAAEAASLARDVRAAAAGWEHVVAEVVAELGRIADALAGNACGRPARPAPGDVFAGPAHAPDGLDWPVVDDVVSAHARLLAPLRAALASAAAGDEWSVGPGPAGVWESGWAPPARTLVMDHDDIERIWQVWAPLAAPDETTEVAGTPGAGVPAAPGAEPTAPDAGPMMPGTEGSRPGTDLGVRIAELPDAPTPSPSEPNAAPGSRRGRG